MVPPMPAAAAVAAVMAIVLGGGYAERPDITEAVFDGYLSKPVDVDELLAAVERHARAR